ncbi:hypothetical protein K227x_38110 [Rubripirellula lacrimiformis]|uniref:Right handed beta helix domain-containing protein n=1 Tax=Rubripirellula lacrimiformis TaxID=1930273 RepID=A0A517NE63_9BACT|nr:right-handed parallel beta-helix repeat-containing protein [Rubripirellula lacrimiformis]QDT05411.1 hypothetical protein K227x_38110 [Rubripirellula lacrimiformis]
MAQRTQIATTLVATRLAIACLLGHACLTGSCLAAPFPAGPAFTDAIPTNAVPTDADTANQRATIDYHVATDGSDDHPGTVQQPFASVHRAQVAARAARVSNPDQAITVHIHPGRYRLRRPLTFQPADSGASRDLPVLYRGVPGGEVVLSGGRDVTDWEKVVEDPGLWKTRLPHADPGGRQVDGDAQDWQIEQLWVNGRRAVRARDPDEGQFYVLLGSSESPQPDEKWVFRHTYATSDGDLRALDGVDPESLKHAELFVFHKWETTREPIVTADPQRNLFTTRGEIMKPHNPMTRDCLYYFENLRAALDSQGEWFLDHDGWLYYRPRDDEDMTSAEVVAATIPRLIDIQGDIRDSVTRVKHLHFEGLKLRHTSFRTPDRGIRSNQAAMNIDSTAVQVDAAEDIQFVDVAVEHVGGTGFWFRKACRDCRVERSRVFDIGVSAVRIGETGLVPDDVRTGGITIDNCILHSGGRVAPHAVGVWIGHSGDNQITHCDVADFFYTAVSVGWRWGYAESGAKRNRIQYNHLHHVGYRILSDMGGVYTLGPSEGTIVSHNVIHDIYATRYGGWGLYPDEGSSHIRFENNLVYNVRDGGFHQHYGRENIACNNIFAFSEEGQIAVTRAEPHRSFTFKRNLVYWDRGHLLGYSGWTQGSKVRMRNNLYWRVGGQPFDFAGKTWQQWQADGNDEGSIIADPMFVDPLNHDFRLAPDSPAKRIGFVPFDIGLAGVQGSADWQDLAKSTSFREPFLVPPSPRFQFDNDFEDDHPVSMLGMSTKSLEGKDNLIRMSDNPDGPGRCLQVQDDPNMKAAYNPHFYWDPKYTTGRSHMSFRIRLDPTSNVACQWRDRSAPYRTGPSLQFSGQAVHSRGRKLLDLPADTWLDVTMEAIQGRPDSQWRVTFGLPNGQSQEVSGLTCDPGWTDTRWVGFISSATDDSSFYLDDVSMRNQ